MSIIFSPDSVALLRTLAEQTVELGETLSQPKSEIFLAQISGAFHDLKSANYDPRVRRTIKFAINEVKKGCPPLDTVERLESSLGTNGVAWFMLDLDKRRVIDNLAQLGDLTAQVIDQLIRSGAQPNDEIVPYSTKQYLDFLPENHSFGLTLVRKNKILSVITFARMSPR